MKKIFFLAASGLCLTMTSAQTTTTLQTQSPDPNLYDEFPDNFWPAPEWPNTEDGEGFLAEEGFLPPPPPDFGFDRPPFPHHGGRHHGFPHGRGGRHHGLGRHHPPPLPFDGEEAVLMTESAENGEGVEFDEPEVFGGFDGFRRHPPFFGDNREGPRGWGGRHHGRHHGRFGSNENVTVAEGEDLINFEDELPSPPRHHKRHHRFGNDDNNGTETGGSWRPFFRRKN